MVWPRLAAVLLGTAFALLVPPVAHADFVVNSTGDTGDASLDGNCDAGAGGTCTLREAIQEANGTSLTEDTITFVSGFNGNDVTSTITTTGLPPITVPAHIDGGDCGSGGTHKPCVGLDSNSAAINALTISSTANGSSVKGLAVFDSGVGVEVSGAAGAITNSWFGLTLAGVVDGNTVGVVVARPGTNVTVGGTTSAARNVFAGSQAAILLQGDGNFVKGNYIGTGPDGLVAAPNAANIIVGDPLVNPTGNLIGDTASAGEQATPACDGPCNVISAATGNGIDLFPPGFTEEAGQTTIRGNFIGLDVGGTLDLGNGDGVFVGPADNVTIGGPAAGDRNFIGGNTDTGIDASDSNADNLTVRNNFVGLSSSGTVALPDGQQAADISADGTTQNNRFGGTATNPSSGALALDGPQVVSGNVIGLGTGGEDLGVPGNGIRTGGVGGSSGSTIGGTAAGAGNIIVNMRGPASDAMSLGADMLAVTGNRIGVDSGGTARPNDGTGIDMSDDSDGSTIGGPSAAAENVISNNGGDAIEVDGSLNSTLIDRNRGSGNLDQFIDLNGDGPGNPLSGGANGNVQAPTVLSASTLAASGTVPNAGSTVRVFRRAAIFAGQVDAFVGQTTATGFTWSLTYPAAIPPGGQLVTTQTPPSTVDTSELSAGFAYTTAPVQSNPPAGGGGGQTPVAGVTAAQILAALKTDLKAVLKALKKPGTAKLAKSVSVKGIDALVPGTVAARITANAPAGTAKRIVVISGKRTFAGPGRGTLKLKATKKGRRLLRRSRRLKLSVALTFTDRAGKKPRASGKVTVKRKRR